MKGHFEIASMMKQICTITMQLFTVWVLMYNPAIRALELAFLPFVSSEIVHDQLSPISSELNKHFPGTYIHVPKDLNDYLNRHDVMDATYADESVASQLITEHNYIPLLVSNEIIKATLVSTTNYTFSELNRKQDIVIGVNQRDLLISGFAMSEIGKNPKYRFFDSNTNLLITLLKKKHMVGALPEEDIDLLPNTLKSKLSILHQRKLSPVYFLINPKHTSIAKEIQNVLFEFHKNWNRSQTKYVYLNYYTLKIIQQDEYDYLSQKNLYEKYNRILKQINSQQ